MRYGIRISLAILATVLPGAYVGAGDFHSWENSLEGWSVDPNSSGATGVPTDNAPAGAVTDGSYALEVGRPLGASWTAVLRAENGFIYDDLIANTTIDLDIYVPSSSFQSWGNMQFQIEGQDMSFSKTLHFNSSENSYHLSWDYGTDPEFNPMASWSQLTMAVQGGGTMNPVYLDNFRLSNRYTDDPPYTVEGGHKVLLDEQFDGDLKIWREPGSAYSGPDTIAAGDGSLVRAPVGERGWRTRYRHGNELTGRTLLQNNEAEWYTDPWYEGTSGSPLGVNPFSLQDGKLHISADTISPSVLSGLPTTDGDETVHDKIGYTSGLLTTQNLVAVKYGRFEMRAQMPSGRGMWPALWLLPSTPGWPPEIDILESHGHLNDKYHVAAHLTQDDLDAGFSPVGGWVDTDVEVPGQAVDITAGFHDYSLDWGADEIIWYFDGVEVGRMDTPPSMRQEMYLLVNLAVGGPDSWPGVPTPTTPFPQELIVDYIRITQLLADYDDDGDVDPDDYIVWRDTFGQSVAPGEGADGNHNGIVDAADYTIWRDGLDDSPFSASSSHSVPEPSAAICMLSALVGVVVSCPRNERKLFTSLTGSRRRTGAHV